MLIIYIHPFNGNVYVVNNVETTNLHWKPQDDDTLCKYKETVKK